MEQFVVGFDLGKEYSQICCWKSGTGGPVSVSVVPGAEKYRIPTESLELFLKKSLRLWKPYGKSHEAAAVVFSVETLADGLVEQIKRTAMQVMGVSENRIYVQTRQESFCAYVLSQSREIWRYQAVLFDYEGELLRAMALSLHTRTTPVSARVEQEKDWQMPVSGLSPEEKDEAFLQLIRKVFLNRPVSAVFLVGDGFEEKWYEESLKILCSGRRVFVGNNLYAKGACYRAVRASQGKEAGNYIFLGADKISYQVGLCTVGNGKESIYPLLRAGESWYEAKAACEVLLLREPVVEFLFQPMQGEEILKEHVYLEGLPERPPKTTRLRIIAEFLKADRLYIQIQDLGFGELFPATDLCWTKEVDLGQEYEV